MSMHAMFDVPRALHEPKANAEARSLFSLELERLLFKGLRVADREEVRALLTDEVFRAREALTSRQAVILAYRRACFLSAKLKLGASELRDDPRRLYALHDWLPLIDGAASGMLSVHYCQALGALLAHAEGRPELDCFIAELEQMVSLGVFLETELGYGDNVAGLETEAVYDADLREFTLSSPTRGSSKLMPNTALAVPTIAIVMARLISQNEDRGVFPFVVRLRGADGLPCPGIAIASPVEHLGDALDGGTTVFARVRIPKEQLLIGNGCHLHDDGRFERSTASPRGNSSGSMDQVRAGRVCSIGAGAAMMRAATGMCVRVASQRVAAVAGKRGVPLLSYRNVQRDVFAGLATAYAVTFAVRFLQRRHVGRSVESESEVFRQTATLKAVVSAEVSEALPRLRERCGPAGGLTASRILDYWNHLQDLVSAEGDNQLMLLKAGRQLLDGTDSPLPVVPGPAVSAALDPQEAVFLFGYREARLKQELKESAGEARRRQRDPLLAWNDNVNRTIALANAYGARLLAECFRVAIADCGDDAGARVLRTLFSLWAAGHVDRHAGWFLSQGCITREAVDHLSSDCDRLCAGIEPHVFELVNAFGIDDTLLREPQAQRDTMACHDSLAAPIVSERKSGAFPVEGLCALEVREARGRS
jgi:acyl-CoA oxidase